MRIQIMTPIALDYVRKNCQSDKLLKLYANAKSYKDVEEYLKNELKTEIFVSQEFDFIQELPELTISEKNRGYVETQNARELYLALIELNDSAATDVRLWAGLSHTVYFDYIRKNLNITYKHNLDKLYKAETNPIENYFIFKESDKRAFFKGNTIPRLWYLGRKFYRKDRAEPFELLQIASGDINMHISRTFTVNLFQNEKTFEAFLEYEQQHIENHVNRRSVSRELFNEQVKYLQRLSGTYSIDLMPKEFIIAKLKEHELEFLDVKESDNVIAAEVIKIFNTHGGVINISQIQSLFFTNKSLLNWVQSEITNPNTKYFNVLNHKSGIFVLLKMNYTSNDSRQNIRKFYIRFVNALDGAAGKLFQLTSFKNSLSKKDIKTIAPQIKKHSKIDAVAVFDKAMNELVNIGLVTKDGDNFVRKINIC